MTEMVELGSERERQFTAAGAKLQQGVPVPGRAAGPLAAILGQELQALERREAALQAEGHRGERRDVQERIAELQDGIAAVRPPSRRPTGR